jgi:hypothetical protein
MIFVWVPVGHCFAVNEVIIGWIFNNHRKWIMQKEQLLFCFYYCLLLLYFGIISRVPIRLPLSICARHARPHAFSSSTISLIPSPYPLCRLPLLFGVFSLRFHSLLDLIYRLPHQNRASPAEFPEPFGSLGICEWFELRRSVAITLLIDHTLSRCLE